MSYMKTVLITGATSGIGKALAKLLSQEGDYRLILCGRRDVNLQELQLELEPCCNVTTLCFDISDRTQVENAIQSLEKPFSEIDVLINNAGNAHGLDPIHNGDIEDWEMMLDINVKGLLYMSRLVSRQMVSFQKGQIINIGSIAGKEAYPGGNVYCASKAAVDSLTQSMRMDLFEYNIRVAAVHPGLVETEFSMVRFKGDKDRASTVYEGLKPLSAEDVASTIAFMMNQPEHVNVADVLLLPTAQASATRTNRK